MRYQQKQKVELEQKRNELIAGRGGAGLSAIDPNENGRALPALIGNGKVSANCIVYNAGLTNTIGAEFYYSKSYLAQILIEK